MQKIVLCSWLVLFAHSPFMACDVCSGPTDSGSMGILPQFQRNFIGLRYSCRFFKSEQPKSVFYPNDNRAANEVTQVAELWGRLVLKNRFHLYAFLPIQQFKQSFKDSIFSNKGFGDVSLSINYMLLNSGDSINKKIKQALLVGVGIKVPTASYRKSIVDLMQVGSGSVDITFLLNHTLRVRKVGFTSEVNYRFNGNGYDNFRFGNKSVISTKLFFVEQIRTVSFILNVGLSWEYASKSRHNEVIQWNTGGFAILPGIGCDIFYKRLIFSINAQQAVYQNLAEGYLTSRMRMTAGVRLSL